MPSFNSLGEWCAGIAGVPSSWGTSSGAGTLIPGGLSADWVTNDVVIVQDCSAGACVLKTYNVRTGVSTVVAPRGANALSAGGGVWAAWFGGYGFFTSTGLHLPSAYLGSGGPEGTHGSVGPDGAVAVKRNYQSFGPYDAHETAGLIWSLTSGAASFPQMLGGYRAVWSEGGGPRTAGACPTPNPMTRPYSWLRMIPPPTPSDPDGWWVLYQDAIGRLLLHPVTSVSGYIIAPAGSLTYRPDFVRLGATIKVVWATNEGEAPSTVVVTTITLTASRTVLGTATPPTWTEPIGPPVPPTDGGGGDPADGGLPPDVAAATIRTTLVETKAPPRQYPHVDGITDWRAQQSVRLLWDRHADLTAQLDTAHANLAELSATSAKHDDELASIRRAAGEALAIAQQTIFERLSGGGGPGGPGPATGPGSHGEPIVAMSDDPAQIAIDVTASYNHFAPIAISECHTSIGTVGYWIGKASTPDQFSDGRWYLGHNKYWEDRMDCHNPGFPATANPGGGILPAVYT